MQSLILEIWLCLLLAFLLGLLLGWLLCSRFAKKDKDNMETELRREIEQAKETGNDNFRALLKDLGSLKKHHEQKAKTDSPVMLAPIEAQASISQIESVKQTAEIPTLDDSPQEATLETVAAPETATDYEAPPAFLMAEQPAADAIDDLKRISGIGPKLEQMLNKLGIYQFDQLANLSAEDVQWVSDHLDAFQERIKTDDWVGQAQALIAEETAKS